VAGVEFAVVGGVAMVLRGSSRATVDLDLCYSRAADNLRRLADALDLGDLDILGEVTGIGGYADVVAVSSPVTVGGSRVVVLDLDALERAKRASGRAKDFLDLAEIAEIRRRLKR
jgi:hypothetical protein